MHEFACCKEIADPVPDLVTQRVVAEEKGFFQATAHGQQVFYRDFFNIFFVNAFFGGGIAQNPSR